MKAILGIFIYICLFVFGEGADDLTVLEGVFSKKSYRSGEKVELVIPFHLPEGWHIYWQESNGETLSSKVLDLQYDQELKLDKVFFSKPEIYKKGEERFLIIKNRAFIYLSFFTDSALSEKQYSLRFDFFYQMCKDDLCLLPQKKSISAQFFITKNPSKLNEEFESYSSLIPKEISFQQVDLQLQDNHLISLTNKMPRDVYFISSHFSKGKKLLVLQANNPKSFSIDVFSKLNYLFNEKEFFLLSPLSQAVSKRGEDTDISSDKSVSKGEEELDISSDQPILEKGDDLKFPFYYYCFLAFLGGIILNFMPCVFPVIFLKIFSLIKNRQESKKVILKNSLGFCLGIIISLMGLALLLLSFRFWGDSGNDVLWGFQSQSPYFTFILMVIFLAIAMNLFGVFEVGVFLSRFGSKDLSASSPFYSFLNGILVTVASTTCMAPFFGTALTVAFQSPMVLSLTIFLFIGLGLSFPYFLVVNVPFFFRFVPRPGIWLNDFKKLIGFMMFFVFLWFLQTFNNQAQASFEIGIYALGFIALALWVYGNYSPLSRSLKTRLISVALSIGLIIFAFFLVFLDIKEQSQLSLLSKEEKQRLFKEKGKIFWEEFTEGSFEEGQRNDRNIFVDFTASWCASCIFNEKFIINRQAVISLLEEKNVLMMKADLTNYSTDLTRSLRKYGGTGVPLYLLYDRKTKTIKKLPSLLTVENLTDELKKLD